MDIVNFILRQIWFCTISILGSPLQYFFASRVTAAIGGAYWIPLGELVRLRGKQSAKDCLDVAEKAASKESDLKEWTGNAHGIHDEVERCYTKAKIDAENNAGWVHLCLVWIFYQYTLCAVLDVAFTCEMDIPGNFLAFLPLLIPYRFYRDHFLSAMAFFAGYNLLCIWWAHAWLAATFEGWTIPTAAIPTMNVLTSIFYGIFHCAGAIFGILVLFKLVSRLSAAISGEYWLPMGVTLSLQKEQLIVDCLDIVQKAKNEEAKAEYWWSGLRCNLDTKADIDKLNNIGWMELCVRWVFYQWAFCAILVDKFLCGIDLPGLLLGFLPLLIPYKFYRDYPLGAMGLYALWTFGCIWWGYAWLTANLDGFQNYTISFVRWFLCEKLWQTILNVGPNSLC
jgi:hypothetical protein